VLKTSHTVNKKMGNENKHTKNEKYFKKFNNNNEHVNKTHAFTCRLYDFIFCQSHASHASRA